MVGSFRTAEVHGIHAPHAENYGYRPFCPPTHMQVLQKIYREKPKGKIAKAGSRTVDVRNIQHIIGVYAATPTRSFPKFSDWMALQYQNKPKGETYN
jgi:hypothetical protein